MLKLPHFFAQIAVLSFLFFITACSSPVVQIYMDGEFADWQRLSPIYKDPEGDQRSGKPDFGRLWITNDADYLYFRVEVGAEVNLQNDNDLALFLDSDDNPNTGSGINGIGADLIYEFGNRQGIFINGMDTTIISHASIGLVSAPTVTSKQFEIAIKRSALPDGKSPLFPGEQTRLVITDAIEGGDILPDKPGGVRYRFRDEVPPPIRPISIRKADPNSIRIMTYNTLLDGLFKPDQFAAMSRIIQAIQPEIIVLEENYNHNAKEALRQIEEIVPSTPESQWNAVKGGGDVIVVSKFSIEAGTTIDGNGAFLIDVHPRFDSKLLLIGAHLPCCGNNEGRRNEIDALMQLIRQCKNGRGEIPLAENTPIILLGDLNLVGDAQQLNTLLTGAIQDTMRFGTRFPPDWDRSRLADLMPFCIGIPFSFTYYDPNNTYGPGRLDFMIYSDSVIEPVKRFVLFTPALPPDSLAAYSLDADDALNASDHLPVVADFVLKNNQ